jgi:polar amino acid transport system substrate-binding protein
MGCASAELPPRALGIHPPRKQEDDTVKRSLAILLACLAIVGCSSSPGGSSPATEAPPVSAAPAPSTGGSAQPSEEAVGPNLQKLLDKGTLNVGTSFDFPPYEFIDEGGNKVGFDIDFLDEIAKRMGLTTSYTDMPFSTIIPAIQAGTIDLSISTFIATPAREELVTFTIPYAPAVEAWLGHQDSTITLSKSEDAANYKIGVQTGGTNEAWINKNLIDTGLMPAENLLTYERQDEAVLDLVNGRVDLVVTEANVGANFAKEKPVKIILIDKEMGGAGYQIPIPKDQLDVKAKLDEIITEMAAEGLIESLSKKWGLQGY